MHDTIQLWMDQAASHPGVLGCGVRLADRTFLVKTCREQISESQLTQAMRELSDAIYFLQQNRIPATHLRWTFENAQIRCTTKPGGVVAALLLTGKSTDLPEVDKLMADFALTVS